MTQNKSRVYLSLSLVLLPLVGFLPAVPESPTTLRLRDNAGQLQISWDHTARTTLQILDKGGPLSIDLTPQQHSLTYARRSGDVIVQIGSTQVRFIGPPPPRSEIEQMRASIEALESRNACLRAVFYSRRAKRAILISEAGRATYQERR